MYVIIKNNAVYDCSTNIRILKNQQQQQQQQQ